MSTREQRALAHFGSKRYRVLMGSGVLQTLPKRDFSSQTAGDLRPRAEPVLRQLLLGHDGRFSSVVDLRGVRLPDDKNHPAEYWSARVDNVEISNVDFSYAILPVNLRASNLSRITFDEATLDRVNLDKAVLVSCSFRNAKVVANMDDTECRHCDFAGTRFGATGSLKEFGGRRTRFVSCLFDGAPFRRVEFRAARFENCTFQGAKFESSDFRGARFSGDSPHREQFDSKCHLSPVSPPESTVA